MRAELDPRFYVPSKVALMVRNIAQLAQLGLRLSMYTGFVAED